MAGGEVWAFDVALATVSADLARAGASVHDQAGRLGLAPDAGRSSDETTRALGGLATTVAGVAEHLGTLASTLNETIAAYRASDGRAQERQLGTPAPQ